MGILETSVSGLLTSQRVLATTSHNISNVNTPGYSRQVVELTTRPPEFAGDGYIGKGVVVNSITRVHSDFVTEQLRSSTSSSFDSDAFLAMASRLDNMLADEQTGLSPSLQNFFNAIQDVADLPSSITARQVLISEAESLVSKMDFLDSRISGLITDVRAQMTQNIGEINTLSQAIAEMNETIVKAQGDPNTTSPNDLLDQRDELIRQLSEFVSVTIFEQNDGSVNVFIGKGQSLVLGTDASKLAVTEPYQGHFEISLTNSLNTIDVTDNIAGGSVGGLLRFQDEMLEPIQNSLGRLAIGLAETFNDQHRLGRNLNGGIDLAFFNVASPAVFPLGTAPNNVTASIVDTNTLTNSNYSLIYNGGTSYTLIRKSDNQSTAIDTLGASPFTTATIDGFTLTITAGATAGDEFIIRPTANGARDIDVLISDPNNISAAAALRSGEAVNANGLPVNTGSAEISQVEINTTTGLPLVADITLTFDAVGNQFIVSAPPGGTLAYNPATESAGKQFTIAAAGNATFTVSGIPADGDQFVIENNTGATGDNRNMLQLAALQSSPLLLNSTSSYQETYGQMVSEVGTQSRQAEISSNALTALLQQATEVRESISGVNLEEEAANMLRFQQAFQASAQMIATTDRLFQSLLNAFG